MNDTPSYEAPCIMLAHGMALADIARVLAIDPAAMPPMLDTPAAMLEVMGTEAALRIGHPLPCDG